MVPFKNRVDTIISTLSGVTMGIYLLIAVSLSLLAIISFYDARPAGWRRSSMPET